jgi:hypothetical protein
MTQEVLAVLEQALPAHDAAETAAPAFKGRFSLIDDFLVKAKREGCR